MLLRSSQTPKNSIFPFVFLTCLIIFSLIVCETTVRLTQFGDAYFLQVLPSDVGDEVDVLVAVLH